MVYWGMTTKEQLLSYLKKEMGNWVSGESLSNKLAISRAAVWKHIGKLKADGYIIESSPKKGYLLSKISDLLLPAEITEGLDTKIFGKENIVYLNEIDSTNIKAKELAVMGAPEGTVVIAEKQTKGRGRRGRSWFSPSGDGIYASLILRPAMSPIELPRITLMTAVAVSEALLSLTQLKIRIKWPNDILVNGKKIAGILTEISTEMDEVDYIIVGLGLNVNTPYESFPEEIRDEASSISMEMGRHFPRAPIVREYLRWYEKYYEMFKKRGFEPIMHRWKELADIAGEQIMVDVLGEKYVGEVLDVGNDGVLLLMDKEGTTHRIFSGDVQIMGARP